MPESPAPLVLYDKILRDTFLGERKGDVRLDCKAVAMICQQPKIWTQNSPFIYNWTDSMQISVLDLAFGFLDALSYVPFTKDLLETHQHLKAALYSAIVNAPEVNVTDMFPIPSITQWVPFIGKPIHKSISQWAVQIWSITIQPVCVPRLPYVLLKT